MHSKVCRERAQSEGYREKWEGTELGTMRGGAGTAAMLLMITKP